MGIFQPPNYSTCLITMGITYRKALITRAAFKLFTVVNLRFQLIVNTKWPHYKGSGTKVPSLAGNCEALSYANP